MKDFRPKDVRPINWIQWLTLMTVVALGAITPILFFRIDQIAHNQSDAIRTVICRAETFIAASKTATPAQKAQAFSFYNDALDSIHVRRCSTR